MTAILFNGGGDQPMPTAYSHMSHALLNYNIFPFIFIHDIKERKKIMTLLTSIIINRWAYVMNERKKSKLIF